MRYTYSFKVKRLEIWNEEVKLTPILRVGGWCHCELRLKVRKKNKFREWEGRGRARLQI